MEYTNVEQLLNELQTNLDDGDSKFENVGNRPHYPIFVSFFGAQTNNCSAFVNNIKNVWTKQICQNLLLYRCEKYGDSIRYLSISDDCIIDIENVYGSISNVARMRGVFAERNRWCLYNVIDTTTVESFEWFEQAYYSYNALQETIDENVRSMLVVILHDSRRSQRNSLNFRIREFLITNRHYEGIVIVSNRTRGGAEYTISEIYKMISSLVLVTDNDAVGAFDDESYRFRITKLYSRVPLTMSYSSIRKPVEEILLCLMNKFIFSVRQAISRAINNVVPRQELEKIIGLENGEIVDFEDLLNALSEDFNSNDRIFDFIHHMPLESPIVLSEIEWRTKKFSEIENLVCRDSIILALRDYCFKFFKKKKGEEILQSYFSRINQNVNLLNAHSFTNGEFERVVSDCFDDAGVDTNIIIPSYFNRLLVYTMKNEIISDQCIEQFRSITDYHNIECTGKAFNKLEFDVANALPVDGFSDVSNLYATCMDRYLTTENGEKFVGELLKIGNDYSDLCRIVKETIIDAYLFCDKEINMPFVMLFAGAMAAAGAGAFMKIRASLDGDGNDEILLRGLYPIYEELSVVMLHAHDADGLNPTPLFTSLKEAYEELKHVQFFNTGNDDTIESLKFYKIDGNNLILGLKNMQNV